jgi:hypothetical protein
MRNIIPRTLWDDWEGYNNPEDSCEFIRTHPVPTYCGLAREMEFANNRYCFVESHTTKRSAYALSKFYRMTGRNARVVRQECDTGDYHIYATPYPRRTPQDFGQGEYVNLGNIQKGKYSLEEARRRAQRQPVVRPSRSVPDWVQFDPRYNE